MIEITRKEFERYSIMGKLFHPDQIMSGLIDIISEIGPTKFLRGAGFNKERDAFIGVLFCYAIRKWSQREWFIQQIQDPPDFYVISPTDRSIKERPVDRIGVELVEIMDESIDLAISTLERTKLSNYFPSEGTALLIFINSKISILNLKEFSLWIVRNKEKFSSFSEVYILFMGTSYQEIGMNYTLVNVLKAWSQCCILKDEFGNGVLFPHCLIDKYKIKFVD